MTLQNARLFIERLAPQLEGFERKPKHTYNFRCPICLDSKTDPTKRRGYFYTHLGKFRFKCHNCKVAATLPEFIKQINEDLYLEYLQADTIESGIHQDTGSLLKTTQSS
jgi:hypothetical protein